MGQAVSGEAEAVVGDGESDMDAGACGAYADDREFGRNAWRRWRAGW